MRRCALKHVGELATRVGPLSVEVEDAVADTHEQIEDVLGARAIVVRGAEAVLEDDDRVVGLKRRARAAQHAQLGAFDVDLDQVGGVVACQRVVEAHDVDRDPLGAFVARVRTLAKAAPPGTRDDMDELGWAGLVAERRLADVDTGEAVVQRRGHRRQRLERDVAAVRSETQHVGEHVTAVGADVDAV